MRRGQLWWANLGKPIGSAPGYRRPVVIIQSDTFNSSSLATVTIATVTSNLRLGELPGNVVISNNKLGLSVDSVINVSQTLTIDRDLLDEPIGQLDSQTMRHVDTGLRLVLSL